MAKMKVEEARALVQAEAWIREALERYQVEASGLSRGQLAERLLESAEELPASRAASHELVRAYAAVAPGRVRFFSGWTRRNRREHLERLAAAGHHAEVERLTAHPAKIGILTEPLGGSPELEP